MEELNELKGTEAEVADELPGLSETKSPSKVTKRKKKGGALYYLTDPSGLLSVLSSGLIRPASADSRLANGLNELCPSRLMLWNRDLPPEVVAKYPDGEADQLIILELNPAAFKGSRIPSVDADMKLATSPIKRMKADTLCVFPAGAIPSSSIQKIYIKDEDELEDLKIRFELMSNFEIDDFNFSSMERLGQGESIDLADFENAVEGIKPCESLADPEFYQRINSISGALLLSSMHLPSRREWLDAFYSLLLSITDSKKRSKKLSSTSLVESLSGMVPFILGNDEGKPDKSSDLETSMMRAAISLLKNTTPKEGLNLETFISGIADYLKACDLTQEEKVSLGRWDDYSRELIKAQVKMPSFSDRKGSVFRKALALFILRPSFERLIQAKNSSLQPGSEVFFLAIVMAGIYEGYARIDNKTKKLSRTSSIALHASALLCNQAGGEGFQSFLPEKLKAQRDESQHDDITQLVSVLIDGHIVGSVSTGPGDAMRGLYGRAKSQGYNLEYDFELDRFHYIFQYEEDRSQRVYISITDPELHDGKQMIRFSSPCMDISGKNKLSATELESLLSANFSPDMHCRFALSLKDKQLLVVVDQLLATNDWDEFEYFCGEVARIADVYERKTGQDRF